MKTEAQHLQDMADHAKKTGEIKTPKGFFADWIKQTPTKKEA